MFIVHIWWAAATMGAKNAWFFYTSLPQHCSIAGYVVSDMYRCSEKMVKITWSDFSHGANFAMLNKKYIFKGHHPHPSHCVWCIMPSSNWKRWMQSSFHCLIEFKYPATLNSNILATLEENMVNEVVDFNQLSPRDFAVTNKRESDPSVLTTFIFSLCLHCSIICILWIRSISFVFHSTSTPVHSLWLWRCRRIVCVSMAQITVWSVTSLMKISFS